VLSYQQRLFWDSRRSGDSVQVKSQATHSISGNHSTFKLYKPSTYLTYIGNLSACRDLLLSSFECHNSQSTFHTVHHSPKVQVVSTSQLCNLRLECDGPSRCNHWPAAISYETPYSDSLAASLPIYAFGLLAHNMCFLYWTG
jgi:hypothetical protein